MRHASLALSCLALLGAPVEPRAECRLLHSSERSDQVFSMRLSQDCTPQDRRAEAVPAERILQALKDGKAVDLEGVLVTGDLDLTTLPVVPFEQVAAQWPAVRQALDRNPSGEFRVIAAPLSMREVLVEGQVATNLHDGFLVIAGPVSVAGTTFEQVVDLSRTIFLEPVDFSQVLFRHEAYFVRARFLREAVFEEASFAVRARFHQAQFLDQAIFTRSGFNGMAEFLEVAFSKDAHFSQARFRLGTGFSGSRFSGMVDLSESLFEREAYFSHTIFEGDAYFRRATFRAHADFSHAAFHGVEDFSKAFFEKEPQFVGTTSSGDRPTPGGLQDPRVLYGIATALLLFTLLFLWALRRG